MEILIALLFIVILVLINQQRKTYSKESKKLQQELRALKEEIASLSVPERKEAELPMVKPSLSKEIKEETTPIFTPDIPLPPPQQVYEKRLEESLYVIKEEEVIETPVFKAEEPKYITPTPKPGFFERNPDLEKFIGENLISKIGIAILVLAVGFFVKYAIDNDWVGTIGRVAIGILCGAILIGLAHRLHKKYTAFSSVLVGGGLAVFYFTITLAYHDYRLFNQTTTFVILLVITAFAVLLSLLYNRQELAIISLVGGFASPFMASSGSGNYLSLFIYLIILNSGLLVIAYRKSWRLLNLLAFIFTVIIYIGWFVTRYHNDPTVYINGFIFATIFYLMFFAINIAHNISENKKFIASDFGILLANTCLYFSAGLYILSELGLAEYRGLFSAVMGIFNMVLSYILFRNKKADNNILYLLIGITLTFVSLTAPIQLKGNHITLFWATETVLLYWLYRKSGIKLMLLTSGLIVIAMLVSLLMDWIAVYGSTDVAGKFTLIPIIINKGFITTIYAAVCSWVLWILHRQSEKEPGIYASLPGKTFHLIAGIVLLYLSGAIEVGYQFASRYPNMRLGTLYWTMYTVAFILLLTYGNSRLQVLKSTYNLLVYAGGIVIYLLFAPIAYQVQAHILAGELSIVHFIAHWITAVLYIILALRLIYFLPSVTGINKNIAAWLISFACVAFVSIEGSLLSNTLFYSTDNPVHTIQRVYIKTGLPILWGLSSFVLMWLGMQNKFRALRIISLALFGITLLKLFLFDIRNIPIAGKIAAFFSLGVLLLVVSFMYQRLKKIIIEDEKKVE